MPGATPIYAAAYNAHDEICRFLVNTCNVDVNAANQDGATGVCVAGQNGHASTIRVLCKELV